MATTLKENTLERGLGMGIVNDKVNSHANDPAVLRQVEKARETLKRVGLPKQKVRDEK